VSSLGSTRDVAAARSRLREGFLEDVGDLEDPSLDREEKMRVVERMWRSWGRALGWGEFSSRSLVVNVNLLRLLPSMCILFYFWRLGDYYRTIPYGLSEVDAKGATSSPPMKKSIDPTALLMYMVNMRIDTTSISVLRLINLTSTLLCKMFQVNHPNVLLRLHGTAEPTGPKVVRHTVFATYATGHPAIATGPGA